MRKERARRLTFAATVLGVVAGILMLSAGPAAAVPPTIQLLCAAPGSNNDCGPSGVAFAPDGATAYVANQNGDSVSVIDVATGAQTLEIPLYPTPRFGPIGPYGITVNAAGTRVYVADNYSSELSVIDTATQAVIATVSLTAAPSEVRLSKDGSILYITEDDGAVHLYDTATNTPVASTPTIAVGTGPFDLELSPDGATLLVSTAAGVRVIDTATNTVEAATISGGDGPFFLAFTAEGTRAYVANYTSSTVSAIDVASRTVTASIAVPHPIGIAITPDGTAYVSDYDDNRIYQVDTATNTLVGAFIPGGSHPHAIAVRPDGTLVFIVNQGGDDTVTVLEATAQPIITSTTLPAPRVGVPYSFTVTTRARPAATFAITAGALPAGLTLNAATGVLSGTPTTAGVSSFTITASNGVGADATASYSLTTAASVILAVTGSDPAPEITAAVALLLMGLVLLIARRRARRS